MVYGGFIAPMNGAVVEASDFGSYAVMVFGSGHIGYLLAQNLLATLAATEVFRKSLDLDRREL